MFKTVLSADARCIHGEAGLAALVRQDACQQGKVAMAIVCPVGYSPVGYSTRHVTGCGEGICNACIEWDGSRMLTCVKDAKVPCVQSEQTCDLPRRGRGLRTTHCAAQKGASPGRRC